MLERIIEELKHIYNAYKKMDNSTCTTDISVSSNICFIINTILEAYANNDKEILNGLSTILDIVERITNYIEDGYFNHQLKIYELKGTIKSIQFLVNLSNDEEEIKKYSNKEQFGQIMNILKNQSVASFNDLCEKVIRYEINFTKKSLMDLLIKMRQLGLIYEYPFDYEEDSYFTLTSKGNRWLNNN